MRFPAVLGASRRRRGIAEVISLVEQSLFAEAWERIPTLAPLSEDGYDRLVGSLLEEWFSLSKEEQASITSFRDNPDAEWQYVPAPAGASGGDRLLLVFCGMAQRFGGCPLSLLHLRFGRLGVHLLYLRDRHGSFYLNGLDHDDHDLGATIARIQSLIEQQAIRRTLAIGISSGGFGALHWGLQLPAQGILSLAGPTDLTGLLPTLRERQQGLGIPHEHQADAWSASAAARLRAADTKPSFRLIHGADNPNDAGFAEDLGHPLPPYVAVEPLPGVSAHNVLPALVASGRLSSLLDDLIGP